MRANRQLPALAVALLVVVLAGCGQVASAQSQPLQGGPFASLHAVRDSGLAKELPTFDYTGADPTAIASLYSAITALKPFEPNASYFCPNDRSVLYHLTFTRADGSQITGLAKPDGCQYASVNGAPYGRIVDADAFWPLFAAAVGAPASALQLNP